MSRQKPADYQGPGTCTWCGHQPHHDRCDNTIKVAAGPSGGQGRAVPTKMIICLCRKL